MIFQEKQNSIWHICSDDIHFLEPQKISPIIFFCKNMSMRCYKWVFLPKNSFLVQQWHIRILVSVRIFVKNMMKCHRKNDYQPQLCSHGMEKFSYRLYTKNLAKLGSLLLQLLVPISYMFLGVWILYKLTRMNFFDDIRVRCWSLSDPMTTNSSYLEKMWNLNQSYVHILHEHRLKF